MQHRPSLALVALAALLAPSAALAAVSPLSDDVLQKVLTNALTSTLSWENGTLARALTDFYYPAVSIYTPGFTTALANRSNALAEDTWVGALAKATLESKVASFGRQSLNGTNAVNGSRDYLSLLDDGAAGDPASLGAYTLLLFGREAVEGRAGRGGWELIVPRGPSACSVWVQRTAGLWDTGY